jgi:hypothetical protein
MQAILRARGRCQRPQGWRRCDWPPSVNKHPAAAGNAAPPLATARVLLLIERPSPGGQSTWMLAGPAAHQQRRRAGRAPPRRTGGRAGCAGARARRAVLAPEAAAHARRSGASSKPAGHRPSLAAPASARPACTTPNIVDWVLLLLGIGLGRTGRAGGRSRSPPGTSRCGAGSPGSTARPARAAARPARPRPRPRSPTARAARAREGARRSHRVSPRVEQQLRASPEAAPGNDARLSHRSRRGADTRLTRSQRAGGAGPSAGVRSVQSRGSTGLPLDSYHPCASRASSSVPPPLWKSIARRCRRPAQQRQWLRAWAAGARQTVAGTPRSSASRAAVGG